MTIFVSQDELLNMFKDKLGLGCNSKLTINIKVGRSSVDSIWLEENNKFILDVKEKTNEKVYKENNLS